MKSRIVTILFVMCITSLIAACGNDSQNNSSNVTDNTTEHVTENAVPNTGAVPNGEVSLNTESSGNESAPSAQSGTTAELHQSEAENIALGHAGLTTAQITGLRTEYEIEDGTPVYEVQFYDGTQEYDYTIHAQNGTIISYDKEDAF